MKREILEAVFPNIKGEYTEDLSLEMPDWNVGFVSSGNVYQVAFLNGKFSAQTLIKGDYTPGLPIPIKAILLLAEYENQPK